MNADIILELLNYTNAYVVVLDSEMTVKFANKKPKTPMVKYVTKTLYILVL